MLPQNLTSGKHLEANKHKCQVATYRIRTSFNTFFHLLSFTVTELVYFEKNFQNHSEVECNFNLYKLNAFDQDSKNFFPRSQTI